MQQARKRIQFVSDRLVDQIVEGRKTASVAELGTLELPEDDYNSALVCGDLCDVYDGRLIARCTIRMVAMEVCRWDCIPERLWRGETNLDADEFRADHVDYFGNPKNPFEFVADSFERVNPEPSDDPGRAAPSS